MNSRITGGKTKLLFKKKVLSKYDVSYYQCVDTGYIQTEEPYWLNEAYSSAISSLDCGLVMRNTMLSSRAEKLIYDEFNPKAKFIDYGGGYGLFVRMMRDKGFDFYRQDLYAPNLFAQFFDVSLLNNNTGFELLTAFEVFEHLIDPLNEIEKMLNYSSNILFSTEIVPANTNEVEKWWYFVPEAGQHVSFYTLESLKFIAQKFNLQFYTDKKGLHLLTKEKLKHDPWETVHLNFSDKIKRKFFGSQNLNNQEKNKSLVSTDFEYIMRQIQNK
jgi:2-polyprenyl-3-methyl-5-hydroxy-6-metoxy-1,4-benzoquinol methylase